MERNEHKMEDKPLIVLSQESILISTTVLEYIMKLYLIVLLAYIMKYGTPHSHTTRE